MEDFDAAIEFKEITDKLKLIGADMTMLEMRKQAAIEGEDFETAKALKLQIEKLKQLVGNLDPEQPFTQQMQDEYNNSMDQQYAPQMLQRDQSLSMVQEDYQEQDYT